LSGVHQRLICVHSLSQVDYISELMLGIVNEGTQPSSAVNSEYTSVGYILENNYYPQCIIFYSIDLQYSISTV